ncbi:MAG: response regulator transcription factor [Archangium sp.]
MKILLVDDHPLFREGLKLLLAGLGPDVVVVEATCAKDARAAFVASLDLILVDLSLPDAKPFELLEHARAVVPSVPVVVVSATETRFEIDRAAELGAQGYVAKSSSGKDMLAALRRVMNGDLVFPQREAANQTLTARQVEVLEMLARGLSNRDIATALDCAENTVKVHLANIYRLLDVTSRTSALMKAQQLGLIRDEPRS